MAMNFPIPVLGPAPHSMPTAPQIPPRARVRGFTLVEMLVALAITLIMMGAVVTLFGVISDSVSNSRAGIEMSDRLRGARNRLQLDLQGATATMRPPLRPENDEGYFEIIEGQVNDNYPQRTSGVSWSLFGDVDDVLMFTTRSRGAPFRGKYKTNGVPPLVTLIESPVAEVVYFLAQDARNPGALPQVIDATIDPPARLYTLYRRELLVAPEVTPTLDLEFYDENDISVRYDMAANQFIANTLGDLTKRENRFAHYSPVFPFEVDLAAIPDFPPPPTLTVPVKPGTWPAGRPDENAFVAPLEHFKAGDDVLLNNVLSFNVQVWDPGAPIYVPASGTVALEPSDPGWDDARMAGTLAGYGAYVDLGYAYGLTLPGPPAAQYNMINPGTKDGFTSNPQDPRIYDTWSLHYEADGLNQNAGQSEDVGPDAGTNGLDDDASGDAGFGVVDDVGELDTLPPYSTPLRGIKVTIRVYEPSSKQVREAVVIQEFLPE